MRPEILRLEDRIVETQATLVRIEQSLARDIAQLRHEVAAVHPPLTPFGCPMPDGTLLVQTVHGNRYLIDPLDVVMGPELIVQRQWEREISALLLSAATKDLVFVDVGANFGYFTCLLGGRIGRGGAGRIYSIEPNPACVSLLRRNVEINWSMCPIEICDCAVGDRSGVVNLFVPANHSANAYLGDAHNKDWTGFPAHEVKVRRLDEIVASDGVVDLMKIDVEGHEHSVLTGARNVIARSPRLRIVMEWSPDQMIRAGYSPERMLGLLRELGLRASRLESDFSPERLLAGALSDDQLLSLGYNSVILTRRDYFV